MNDNLFTSARTKKSLQSAWQSVQKNGYSSKSKTTRDEIKEFALVADSKIDYIARKLREDKFIFPPASGIRHRKKNSSGFRPIVRSPVESRIVQRSILNALQKHQPLMPYFNTSTSFGGIKYRSVKSALVEVKHAIDKGCCYYLKSDIASFFTKIPKDKVIEIVSSTTDNEKFISLFANAINVELENLIELGSDITAFPIHEIGVAQGSCLSPLLGNILLHEFDVEMNSSDVFCFRYIDDFIILGPSLKAVNAFFKKAQSLLSKYNLEAYDSSSPKYGRGKINDGFAFLGCDIRPGIIKPNRQSVQRLLTSIDDVIDESIAMMLEPEKIMSQHKTVVESLNTISHILSGWGNQYSFCNDAALFNMLDSKIDERISQYLNSYQKHRKKHLESGDATMVRRLLGVHPLSDSKSDPIIK